MDGSGNLYAVQDQQGLVARRATSDPDGTWVALHDEPQALAIAVSSSGSDLYLSTAGRGLWVSLDGGGQWVQPPVTGDDYLPSVQVVPQHGAVVACGQAHLYHSPDEGRTWAPVPGLPKGPLALTLAPNGKLLVGLPGGIARSGDGGLIWTLGGEGLPADATVVDLAVASPEDTADGIPCTPSRQRASIAATTAAVLSGGTMPVWAARR